MTRVLYLKQMIHVTALAVILACSIRNAWAAPPAGSVRLNSSSIFQVQANGTTYTCGRLPPWVYGRMAKGNFYPSKVEIANLKKKLRAATSTKAQTKFRTQIAAIKQKQSVAKPLCSGGPPGGGGATPTPTPAGNEPFDSLGNVTSYGKNLFQIPANLSASASRGITFWNQTCNGCHNAFPSSLPLRTYPAIRARIQLSPMSFSVPAEVSDQNIADITAIANY